MNNVTFPKVVEKMRRFDGEFVFNGEKYLIDTPKTIKELIFEGYLMHNCLVMRGPDVAKEKMRVVFIKTEEGKSYIDIIMDRDWNIIWTIKDYHENVKGDESALIEEWYKKCVIYKHQLAA